MAKKPKPAKLDEKAQRLRKRLNDAEDRVARLHFKIGNRQPLDYAIYILTKAERAELERRERLLEKHRPEKLAQIRKTFGHTPT